MLGLSGVPQLCPVLFKTNTCSCINGNIAATKLIRYVAVNGASIFPPGNARYGLETSHDDALKHCESFVRAKRELFVRLKVR